jgi:hypothetical protein
MAVMTWKPEFDSISGQCVRHYGGDFAAEAEFLVLNGFATLKILGVRETPVRLVLKKQFPTLHAAKAYCEANYNAIINGDG